MIRTSTKEASPALPFVSAKEFPISKPHEEGAAAAGWEVRPCGMLVQTRSPDAAPPAAPAPTVCVRVKYGAAYHDVHLSSQATFGELKKLLSARTGLHPGDQKLVFKKRERDSAAYLDTSGVRDKSKIVLLEDPAAQARRCLEMRRAAKADRDVKSISQISLRVDVLASQVAQLEAVVSKGKRVAEKEVLNLIELLMTELVKLDGIAADGDVKLQRRMQVRRVQNFVVILDALKIKNAMPKTVKDQSSHQQQEAMQQQQQQQQQQQYMRMPPPAVVTTKWEIFDSLFSPTASATASAATSTTSTTSSTPTPRFDWELF